MANLARVPNSLNFTKQKENDALEYNQLLNNGDRLPIHFPRTKKPRPIEHYEYYAAIAFDPDSGKIVQRVSPSLHQNKGEILETVIPKFSAAINVNLQPRKTPGDEAESMPRKLPRADRDQTTGLKVHRGKQPTPDTNNPRKKPKWETSQKNSSSQHRARQSQKQSPEFPERKNNVSFRVDDRQEWEEWMSDAFRTVQQVSCRVIAKEWIKTIHPKKQSTNPYNGKLSGTRERGNSELTKPPYWPPDVIHKEPDHINKEQRTRLLVYLLMGTPHQELSVSGEPKPDKEIKAETLKESLDSKRSDELRSKWDIITSIIHVRSQLEKFEEGGLPANATISAPNYSDASRPGGTKADELSDDAKNEPLPRRPSYNEDRKPKISRRPESKQEVVTTQTPNLHDVVPDRTSFVHRRDTNKNLPHNFSSYQRGTTGTNPKSSPVQNGPRQTEPIEKSMDIDDIAYKHSLDDQQTELASHASTQIYHPEEFTPQQFQLQAYHHWPSQQLDMNPHYHHDTSAAQSAGDINDQHAAFDHIYASSMAQPTYYTNTIYNDFDHGVQHQQQVQHSSLSNQYDQYASEIAQSRGMMNQSYYSM